MKKPLTAEQQKLSDAATTYTLAGCMMMVYQLMQARRGPELARVLANVGVVLSREPTYMIQFEMDQKRIMDEYNALMKTRSIEVVSS